MGPDDVVDPDLEDDDAEQDDLDQETEDAPRQGAKPREWIGPWVRRIFVRPLGTDPVLRHALRSPVPGKRICEATLYRGNTVDSTGWIVQLTTGRMVFATLNGSVRAVSADMVAQAIAAMEGADVKAGQKGHRRIDGARLRELLEQIGYTQASFAREWGVTDRNVRRWTADELDVPLWVGKVLVIMGAYGIGPIE